MRFEIYRIHDHARWCFSEPKTGNIDADVPNAAAVGLVESLPPDRRVSEDLYRWLSAESFDGFENLFRYHLSDAEYQRFATEFLQKKEQFIGQSRL